MESTYKINISIIALCISFVATDIFAFGVKPSNGVSLSVGPGIGIYEKYSGSDEVSTSFIPYIDMEYTAKNITGFLSISDGLGGKYRLQYPGLFISGGANLGNPREPGDADILEDTAEVSNFVTYFVKTGYESGFIDFFITANYYPINMKYKADVPDENKKGLLSTMSCVTGYPIFNNLLVAAEFGCSVMNSDYARAYYGIKYRTRRLEEYEPDAGLNRIYFEPTAIFFTGYDVSINIQGHYERLLSDAAKSPLVKNKNVFTGLLYLSYDI